MNAYISICCSCEELIQECKTQIKRAHDKPHLRMAFGKEQRAAARHTVKVLKSKCFFVQFGLHLWCEFITALPRHGRSVKPHGCHCSC